VENIPLNEAVARGIIPCSVCGASGAEVRKIGTKNHFLCPRCARRSRLWTLGITGLTILIVALGGFWLWRRHPAEVPSGLPPGVKAPPDPEPWMKETLRLMQMKRFQDARVRIAELLEPLPKQPELNILMGRCLMSLRAYDAALPYLTIAYEAGPPFRDEAGLRLGLCYKTIGRAAQALKYLEGGDKRAGGELAEVYLDLERYDDALRLLKDPDDSGTLWARHRALVYLGRAEEAKKLLEGRDEKEVGTLRAGQLREEGDFQGARKILESLKPEPGSPAWHRVQRGLLSLSIESGNLGPLEAVIDEFMIDPDPQIQGEAIFAVAIAALLRGEKERARTQAWKFLAKTDKEFSPLRLERMMMRHLVGEQKDADLEAEAKLLSRFHANDLLWYLALATGDRAWAEKAAASTPGHNYPYHSIQRLLKK
jgi:tetratricopeptide (TPR) repeat protein